MDPSNYPAQNRRGCLSRLMGPLFIIAIAFFLYFANTEKNPVTGVSQRVGMSPTEEVRLGIEAAPQMSEQMGGEVSAQDPRAKLVQQMGNQLVQRTEAKKGPWKFQFHLLKDSKTINAFALPGGQIFITLGLFNELQNEAQLAGVLGHEMGHVIQRHAAQQMAKGQLGQMLVLATQVGISDGSSGGSQAALIANVINQMTQLHYGRSDELEADIWGINLMSKAGYNPEAMLEVMQILKKAGSSAHGPEMLQTHPYPEKRIEQIQEYLRKNRQLPSLRNGRNLKDIVIRGDE